MAPLSQLTHVPAESGLIARAVGDDTRSRLRFDVADGPRRRL